MAIVEIDKNHSALIDDKDVSFVCNFRWRIHRTHGKNIPRAMTTVNNERRYAYMHTLLMKPKIGEAVCHIDGDYLNNRRDNLLIIQSPLKTWASKQENTVGLVRVKNKWVGRLGYKNRSYDLRACEDKKDAQLARNYVVWRLKGPMSGIKEKDFRGFDRNLLTRSIIELLKREEPEKAPMWWEKD